MSDKNVPATPVTPKPSGVSLFARLEFFCLILLRTFLNIPKGTVPTPVSATSASSLQDQIFSVTKLRGRIMSGPENWLNYIIFSVSSNGDRDFSKILESAASSWNATMERTSGFKLVVCPFKIGTSKEDFEKELFSFKVVGWIPLFTIRASEITKELIKKFERFLVALRFGTSSKGKIPWARIEIASKAMAKRALSVRIQLEEATLRFVPDETTLAKLFPNAKTVTLHGIPSVITEDDIVEMVKAIAWEQRETTLAPIIVSRELKDEVKVICTAACDADLLCSIACWSVPLGSGKSFEVVVEVNHVVYEQPTPAAVFSVANSAEEAASQLIARLDEETDQSARFIHAPAPPMPAATSSTSLVNNASPAFESRIGRIEQQMLGVERQMARLASALEGLASKAGANDADAHDLEMEKENAKKRVLAANTSEFSADYLNSDSEPGSPSKINKA